MLETLEQKKLLLIDDDPVYRLIMTRVAEQEQILLDCYASIFDMEGSKQIQNYDAAIIDYDLVHMTGPEVAQILAESIGNLPILIISENHRIIDQKSWPHTIRGFIKKSSGYSSIIFHSKMISNAKQQFESLTSL